jgi:hypothetical protein
VKTQAPYALTGAGMALISYFIFRIFHVPSWVALLIGLALIYVVTQLIGKKVDDVA